MQNFDYTLNKDDVAERNIIVSLLGTLYNKLFITNYRNNVPEKINIPFYYSFNGDERYLYDMFMKPLFDNDGKAIGNYDSVPRGVIQYKSSGINIARKTNPNVYGKLLKSDTNGITKTYFAKYRPIPITMSFDCKILVSPNLDLFKVSEKIKTMLYKNTIFYTDIRRTKIPGIITIPEDIDQQRPLEFNFTDKKELSVEFSFDVITYIPVFDEKSEKFAGNKMQGGIYHGIYIRSDNSNVTNSNSVIKVIDDTREVLNIPKDINYAR